MYCMHCGAANDDSARFCLQCGKPLPVSTSAPAPAAPQPRPVAGDTGRSGSRALPARTRHVLALVAGLAIGLLLIIGGLAVVRQWLHLGTNDAVKFMPAETSMMLSVSPGPLQIRQIQKLQAIGGIFGAAIASTGAVHNNALENQLDIDFQKDVVPWAGLELAASLVSTGRQEPALVAALAVRNSGGCEQFVAKVRGQMEKQGRKFSEEKYHNIKISFWEPVSGEGLVAAQLNGFLVASTSLEAMHKVIDVAQGRSEPLAKGDAYQKTLKGLRSGRAGYVYLDWLELQRAMGPEASLVLGPMSAGLESLGASLTLDPKGVRLDYVASFDAKRMSPAQVEALRLPANRNQTPGLVPPTALVFVSGQGLRSGFDQMMSVAQSSGESTAMALSGLSQQLGLKSGEELFKWADGEYALAFLEDSQGLLGDNKVPLGLAILVATQDRKAAESDMQTLGALLGQQMGVSLSPEKLGGTEYQILQSPFVPVSLGYGFVDDVLVIGSSKSVLTAVAEARRSPLSKSAVFRQATSPLPSRNGGYVYLDMERLTNILYQAMPSSEQEDFDKDVRPYLDPVRAVAAAGQQPAGKDGVISGTAFVLYGETKTKD